MNAKVLFVVVLCAALLATAFVDAKKVKQDKKGKGKDAKAKVKVQKREVKEPVVEKVVEKVIEKVVEVEKPAAPVKAEKPVAVEVEEELIEEEPVVPEVPEVAPERPRLVKPKHLKTMTAYEECKLQCKKQRDQEDAQHYVERLRAELAQAEALIAAQETANAQEAESVVEEVIDAAEAIVQ